MVEAGGRLLALPAFQIQRLTKVPRPEGPQSAFEAARSVVYLCEIVAGRRDPWTPEGRLVWLRRGDSRSAIVVSAARDLRSVALCQIKKMPAFILSRLGSPFIWGVVSLEDEEPIVLLDLDQVHKLEPVQ